MLYINPAGRLPKLAGEPRQLLFLALCSLALVVAAFAAPPTAQGSSPPDVPIPELFGNESDGTGACTVTLSEEPVPGREVTVNVHRGARPVEGVHVWFDDRSVGVTNRSGQVDGQVPYVQDLEVTVALPGGGSCEFVTATGRPDDRPPAALGAGPERAGLIGANATPDRTGQLAAQTAAEENVTGSYAIHSPIRLGVVGEANPGEDVVLVATIEGDPVPAATVSVDGDEVGRTDEDGRYALTVPDDGTERLTVRVQRGELVGQTRIDVRLLRASVRGDEQFPLPGQSATVRAAIGNDAAVDADVLVDGERVGTTNALGRTKIDLPTDPTATATVTTGDRTTRTWILSAYAPTIVAGIGILLVVVGFPLALYWAGGRRAVAGLFGLAANLITGAAGYAVAGRDGALFAVGSTVLLILLVLFVRRPHLAHDASESTGRLIESGIERITSGVLWFTRGIEVLVDQVASSLDSALTHLRDFELAPITAGIRPWFVPLLGRVLAGLVAVVTAPRRLYQWFRSDSDPETEEPAVDEREPTPTGNVPGPAIRELWRAFARRVVPERWPQRTPGEVSRRAIDAGFPRESVVELTSVFRDVEYGGDSLSDDHYRRARTAFDALDVDSRRDSSDAGDDTGDEPGDGEVSGS